LPIFSRSDIIATPLAGQTLAPFGADLVIAEWTASGTPVDAEPQLMAPHHLHYQDSEAWYVLEGTLGVQIGDITYHLDAGDAIVAPPMTKHTFWNPKPTPVRYLIIMTAQIKALIDAIHATEQRAPETMKQLFEKYGSKLL
jgi:mannose-6-phosphate isomerase-like protein (cupin superfamily)